MTGKQSLLSIRTVSQDSPGIRARGFTLIELLVALGIGAIVLSAIYSVYGGLTRSYTTQNVAADIQQVVRAGIDFMVEDMITAGLNPNNAAGIGIAVATSTSIRFSADRNMNGTLDAGTSEEITYAYVPTSNRLDQCLDVTIGTADCQPFIDNVTALTFTYLDAAGNDLGDPVAHADLDDIRTIVISMTVQEPAGRQGMIARTYSTRFRCRNLGI
jgi:prepilin-type N-terminal cleavage/methylation domain-containing protein